MNLQSHTVKQSQLSKTQSAYWLYGLAFWLVLVASLGAENFASIDLWGKLSIPALWTASHIFPLHDPFSFTAAGKPWIDHEWLSGFSFYQALLLGGDMGLTLLKWGMVGMMIAAVFGVARLRRIAPVLPFVILLIGLPMLVNGLMATGRPQLFTFSLIPLLILLLETVRQQKRYRLLWSLFPFFLVWANLHGGFVAGLGIVGCYAVGEAFNRKPFLPYLGGMVLILGASLLNPYGLAYWYYLVYAITLPRPEITEWRSVPLWTATYLPVKFLGLGVVAGLGTMLLKSRSRALDWVLLLLFPLLLHQAFSHLKHQPILVLVVAALLPLLFVSGRLPAWVQKFEARWLPLLCLLGSLVWLGTLWQGINPLQVQVRTEAISRKHLSYAPYPVGAIQYLARTSYHGNLLTPFSWGEFAYWVLYPRFRVSLDGRLEAVYPMPVFHQVEAFYRSQTPDSWKIPAQLGAEFILSERKTKNIQKLLQTRQWVLLYEDRCYVVLGKRSILNVQQAQPVPKQPTGKALLPVSAFFQPPLFLPRFKNPA